VDTRAGLFVITQHTKHTFVPSNTVPKVEERSEVKDKDEYYEVGKARRPNTSKEDDGNVYVLQYSTNMKLPLKFNGQQFFDIFTLLVPHLSKPFHICPFVRHSDLRHTH
jgi:hypothetical protein